MLTFIAGFILLSKLQREVQFAGIWDAICSASAVSTTTQPADVVKATD